MWKSIVVALLFVAPALAQEQATAYEALRVVGTQFGRGALNHLVSITGVGGNPQPEKWKITLDDPRAPGRVREVEVADGRIASEGTPSRSIAGSTEGAMINTRRLISIPTARTRSRDILRKNRTRVLRLPVTRSARMNGVSPSGLSRAQINRPARSARSISVRVAARSGA